MGDVSFTESDIPELVAFLQKGDPQVKDICIDAQIHYLAEKCELDHNNISYILNYELYKYSMEAPERVLFVTTKAESFPEPDCTMNVVKQCNSDKSMKDKLDSSEREGFVDSNSFKEDSPERRKEKQIQESETEAIFVGTARSNNVKSIAFDTVSKSNLETRSSKVDISSPNTMNSTNPTEANADSEQSCKSENISNIVMASSTVSRLSQNKVNLSDHDESSPVAIPATDHFTLSGPLQRSDSISFRSTSSATSTRSFAFPVLSTEWPGSPVRMEEAHKARLKKHKRWKTFFCC